MKTLQTDSSQVDPFDPSLFQIKELSETDDVSAFTCGDDDLDHQLDNWLKQDALRCQRHRSARTYLAYYNGQLAAYMALLSGAISIDSHEKKKLEIPRSDPSTIPAIKIGRLATAKSFRGFGIGTRLIQFAYDMVITMSERIGCRLLIVDAYQKSISFYERMEFVHNKLERKRNAPEADSAPENRETTASMRFDVFGRRLPIWAVENIIGGTLDDFEKQNPDWFVDVVFDMMRSSLKNLRHYIESGDEKVTWDSPFVELHRIVDWKQDEDGIVIVHGEFSPEDRSNKEFLSKKMAESSRRIIEYNAISRLVGDGTPFVVGKFPGFDGPGAPPHRNVGSEVPFRGNFNGVRFAGTVVAAFYPLTIDPESQKAYFPIGIGLLFKKGNPSTWSKKTRASFWSALTKMFKPKKAKRKRNKKR